MTDPDIFEPPVFYCTDAIHRDIQDRAWAEATAAAEQRLAGLRGAVEQLTLAYHTFNGRCTTDLPSCTDSLCVGGRAALLDAPAPASPRQGEPVDQWTAEGLEPFTPKNETGLMLGVAIGALFQSGRNEAHLASCPVARDVIWIIGRRHAALSEPAEAAQKEETP